jgi:hypothetical protein
VEITAIGLTKFFLVAIKGQAFFSINKGKQALKKVLFQLNIWIWSKIRLELLGENF